MKKTTLTRKEFLSECASLTVGIGLLSVLSLESCSTVPTVDAEWTAEGARVKKSEFTVHPSFKLGRKHPFVAPVFVEKVSDQVYTAVQMKCTHKGCELVSDGPVLSCPCHGAEFSHDGTVLSPPATENLKTYRVSIQEETITIHFY